MAHETARAVLNRAIEELERDRTESADRLHSKEEDIEQLKKDIAINTGNIEKIKKSLEALEKL